MSDANSLDDLISRSGLGDRSAFSALYHATAPEMTGKYFTVLNDEAETEAVLFKLYLRVWDAALRFKAGRDGAEGWLSALALEQLLVHRADAGQAAGDLREKWAKLTSRNVAPVQPAPVVWKRITGTLFDEEQRSIAQKLGLWQALIGAALAGLIGYAALELGLLNPLEPEPPKTRFQARLVDENQSVLARVAIIDAPPRLAIERSQTVHDPLEIWLIPVGQDPVLLGQLPATRQSLIDLPSGLMDALRGAQIALTAQGGDGAFLGQGVLVAP